MNECLSMMYLWDVQSNIPPDDLKDVLNEFDGAGYDIYSVFQEVSVEKCSLKYTVIARMPQYPAYQQD